MLEEVGCSVVAASTSQQSCRVELLAGDPAAAERELRRDFDELSEMGERYFLSTAAGELARAVYAQGRYVETTIEKVTLAVGDDVARNGRISDGKLAEIDATLGKFKEACVRDGATPIVAVGTAAFRDAANGAKTIAIAASQLACSRMNRG